MLREQHRTAQMHLPIV